MAPPTTTIFPQRSQPPVLRWRARALPLSRLVTATTSSCAQTAVSRHGGSMPTASWATTRPPTASCPLPSSPPALLWPAKPWSPWSLAAITVSRSVRTAHWFPGATTPMASWATTRPPTAACLSPSPPVALRSLVKRSLPLPPDSRTAWLFVLMGPSPRGATTILASWATTRSPAAACLSPSPPVALRSPVKRSPPWLRGRAIAWPCVRTAALPPGGTILPASWATTRPPTAAYLWP